MRKSYGIAIASFATTDAFFMAVSGR